MIETVPVREKYGLIGHPIADSLSPALFKAAYGGGLPYDLIEGASFPDAFRRFTEEAYTAVNVTAPFKEAAFRVAVERTVRGAGRISGPCFKIGAANLLIQRPWEEALVSGEEASASGKGTADSDKRAAVSGAGTTLLEACNTDFSGVILSVADTLFPGIVQEFDRIFGPAAHKQAHRFCRSRLRELYMGIPRAVIVGCGGAGRAAAVAAAEMGFTVVILNRTLRKAQDFAASLPEYGFRTAPLSAFAPEIRRCDLLIYTLPARLEEINLLTVSDLAGEVTDNGERPRKILFESAYTVPAFQPKDFVKFLEAGAVYISGREWLVYQALAGYPLMTGKRPDLYAMKCAAGV